MSIPWLDAYHQLATRGLWLADPWGSRLVVGGHDRIGFLQNFTTNDVTRATPGAVVETFFLNPKGHIVVHALIAFRQMELIVYTLGGTAEELATHLNRYIVREQVTLEVLTAPWWIALGGCGDGEIAPDASSATPRPQWADIDMEVFACPLFHKPACIIESHLSQERLELAFEQSGYFRPGIDATAKVVLEAVRIESGVPLGHVDYPEGTLPQELDRNSQALNFQKGCYLGQETVARIDALGHVNKLLRGIQFDDDNYPYIGISLESRGRAVGTITSFTYSPRLKTGLGLALVRREAADEGTPLTWANGNATVVKLPVESRE